ncbi:MAG: guanylate kinase [Alphaproteobacteria bacterium]|nr:guanylate kinase [Alphaproteobacteria bacterium]
MTVPQRQGLMFVLSSPSGAGKTTLSRRLLERQTNTSPEAAPMVMSVSITTRPKRPGEVEGRDYFFVSPEDYGIMVAQGALLEHAEVFGYGYGTPRAFVNEHLTRGVDVLFDIDWQGTRQLAAASRDDLVSVFILPPSLGELERRLRARAQDSDEVVARRMDKAAHEISHWQEYDYVLVNDDLDATLSRIEHILEVERLRRARQSWLRKFIENSLNA